MKKTAPLLAPAVLSLVLGACADLSTSIVCPDVERPAVVLTVVDAETGASVAAQSIGTWTTGTLSDSLRHVASVDGREYLAAYGPPGVYDVSVVRPGGSPWVRRGIAVQQGNCGPSPTQVTAMIAAS
jgi:hypothetical protein